jgi:Ca-activated chloride channel family protein
VAAPRYLGAGGRVPLNLLIRDKVSADRLPESPSHAIRAGRRDDGLELGLADPEGAAFDRDLVVRWPVATPAVGLALDTGRPPAGRTAMSPTGSSR